MTHPTPKNSNELFLQLRAFSDRYQALHELQVDHLKKWPFAVNPNVDKSTAQVDFEKKVLTYLWGFKKKLKPLPKDYTHRLQELVKGVRFLLGDTWQLKIQDLSTNDVIFTSDAIAGTPKKPGKPGRSKAKRLANRRRK